MIDLTGDKELLRKLDSLAKKDIKAAVRKGCRMGNKDIQKKAKALAPKKTGLLRRSIKVRSMPRSRVYTGSTVKAGIPHAAPQEYGTKFMAGKEFMKQAAKETGKKAGETAAKVIRNEVIERAKKA